MVTERRREEIIYNNGRGRTLTKRLAWRNLQLPPTRSIGIAWRSGREGATGPCFF